MNRCDSTKLVTQLTNLDPDIGRCCIINMLGMKSSIRFDMRIA